MKKIISEMNFAHRGLHGNGVAENSMTAFGLAIENGFGIELDVRMNASGDVVVFHDESLARMCGISKKISDVETQELKNIFLLKTESTIPLLKDVLIFVGGKVPLLIEIKSERKTGRLEKEVIELLKGYEGEILVQSFNPFSLREFKKHAPEIPRGQLSCFFEKDNIPKFEKFLLKNLAFNFISKPDFISFDANHWEHALKITNKPVFLWTVRKEEQFEKVSKHVSGVIFENFLPKID